MIRALSVLLLACVSCGVNEVLPADRGPALVVVPTPSGGTLAIDQTEVTRAHYARFLDDGSPSVELPASCGAKTNHLPDPTCLADPAVCVDDCDDHPQVCVDWCDAVAFCLWSGRRLCGAIGGGSAPFEPPAPGEPMDSQWLNACSSGGRYFYPYGNDYDRALCHGGGETSTTSPVGSLASCQPFNEYRGVYDLAGNAAEWEDSCEDPLDPEAHCRVRGGAFRGDALQCETLGKAPRSARSPLIGFRCCS